MKYRPSRALAAAAGLQLAAELPHLFPDSSWDYVVPVPASTASLKVRLFSQCCVIAGELQRTQPQLNLQRTALLHCGQNRRQAHLSHAQRLRNVAGVFAARPEIIRGAEVLLIDDVVTTGATAAAAATALLAAGAAAVDLAALARGPAWSSCRRKVAALYPLSTPASA